jgi:MscS family membrane protein
MEKVEKTVLIDINSSMPTNIIDSIDMDMDTAIQPLLNQLYDSKYGDFWSYPIWNIPVAQLVGATLVLGLFLLFRKLFTNIVLEFLFFLAKKSKTNLDDEIITKLKDPIRFGFVIIGLHLFVLLIFVKNSFIHLLLESLIIYTIFWAFTSLIDVFKNHLFNNKNADKRLSKELVSFITKVLKGFIIAIGASVILNNWGVNITGIVASLGLGGLAFALAAKDTASNLFASIALLLDNSIKIGEWVKVSGVEGVVESIGMRTTKIRSFEKSIFTVPNHVIANNPIENFSRRGVRRIKMGVGLTYDTTSEQVERITQEIRDMFQNHPKISQKDTLLVNFNEFGDSALNIFIYAFTNTAQWDQYLDIREDIHLKIIKIVESNGSSFAFPSQSLYIESLPEQPNKLT